MDEFWQNVEKSSPEKCWLWIGSKIYKGYGKYKNDFVHRISYEITKGKIPNGLTIDHLCFNKLCVNPKHLEAVTNSENVKRYHQARTHCKYGHPFNEKNTRIDKKGYRVCLACEVRRKFEYKTRLQRLRTKKRLIGWRLGR